MFFAPTQSKFMIQVECKIYNPNLNNTRTNSLLWPKLQTEYLLRTQKREGQDPSIDMIYSDIEKRHLHAEVTTLLDSSTACMYLSVRGQQFCASVEVITCVTGIEKQWCATYKLDCITNELEDQISQCVHGLHTTFFILHITLSSAILSASHVLSLSENKNSVCYMDL